MVRPGTVAVRAPVVVALTPPGMAVTVYPVIGEPPLLTGAVHDTWAWPLPAVAVTPVGAPGIVELGVTAVLGADALEVPVALVAVTVNVYAVPLVRPDTVELTPVVLRPVQAGHAGDDVIVYPVIGEPPLLAGAVQVTTACPFPALALTPVGAPGRVPRAWTTQVKVALPLAEVPSVTVTVTVELPAVLGVPEINPVPELITRPAGRPVAE